VGGLRLMPSRLAARCKVAAATDKTGYKTQGFIILRPQIHGGLHDSRHLGSALRLYYRYPRIYKSVAVTRDCSTSGKQWTSNRS
jgi:hypothetical protein